MEELKKCPFCGGEAILKVHYGFDEIYYINLWKPPLNVDDKARDNLSISLPDKEWIEFIPANWDKWKNEIDTDNSGVALWHRLRNEKALRGV